MKTLILGGVRSGKSRLAEKLAIQTNKPIIYIATATGDDEEMLARIELHKNNRPKDWEIIEEGIELSQVLDAYSNKGCCIIIDCLTLWLTNLLLSNNGDDLATQRQAFNDTLSSSKENIFIVSNETSLGIMPLGELTRRFGDEAGVMNQDIAARCDRVILTVAGLPLILKEIKNKKGN